MEDDVTEEEQREYEAALDRMCAEWEQQVRNQARAQATRSDVVYLYEARFGSMPGDLRAALARIRGEDRLRRIVLVSGTRTAEDVSTAVREALDDSLRQTASVARTVVRDGARATTRR